MIRFLQPRKIQYCLSNEKTCTVIPAQAEIQAVLRTVSPLDSRLRGNDDCKFFSEKEPIFL
jgi:hypothetical protein